MGGANRHYVIDNRLLFVPAAHPEGVDERPIHVVQHVKAKQEQWDGLERVV